VEGTRPNPPPGCFWLPPQYSPQSVTIGGGINNITVTNGYQCIPLGALTVTKTVDNKTNGSVAGIAFPIKVTCTASPPLPPIHVSFNLTDGGSHSDSFLPGSNCTVTETLPTAAASANLCPAGTLPVWSPPTYSPTSAVIGTTPVTITVHNTVRCVNAGSLTVQKSISLDPTGTVATMSFPMTVTCSNTSAVYPLTIQGTGSAGPINLPVGSTCHVAEGTLPTLPAGCSWGNPTYTPASVTIANGGNVIATVNNSITCQGYLVVYKVVTNNSTNTFITTPFSFHIDCSNGYSSTQTGLSENHPWSSNATLPYGTTCTVAELMPLPPPFTNAQGQTCTWSQQPPLGAQTVIISAGGSSIQLNNSYTCTQKPGPVNPIGRPAIECRPPLVPNGIGSACVCPQGSVQRGNECVHTVECRPPLVPNGVGSACVCPQGTVQRGRDCVHTVECRPPLVPNGVGSACVCPQGTVQRGRDCVHVVQCGKPLVPNAAGTACVCPNGSPPRGGSCVEQADCRPPAKSNGRGGCECPGRLVLRGNSCVDPGGRPPIEPPHNGPVYHPGAGPGRR